MAADITAALNFMREKGLSASESALMEDLLNRSDFEMFLFPLHVNVNVPVEVQLFDHDDSSDEFVSLVSSTSEFTNPYGIRTTTEMSSRSSSERLSQFGTARAYHDFDMQNDLSWYNAKDDDFNMPGLDPFICPTEDKFIMAAEIAKPIDSHLGYKQISEGCESVEVTSCDNLSEKFINETGKNVKLSIRNGSGPHFEHTLDVEGVLTSDTKCEQKNYRGDDVEDEVADVEEVTDESLIYDANEDEYEVFHLRIIHRKNRTGFEEHRDLTVFLNSIIAGRYCVTEYLGSAAFSKVVQAQDLLTGTNVSLKIIKNNKDFFDQSLDEIKVLKFVNKHDPNDERHILRLYDYFYYQEHLFIVTELLRANLYEFQKHNQESRGEPYFTLSRIQLITKQCLEALDYLHCLGIIHCDLKPENILMKSYRRCEVKVIDLGSSCFQTDNLCLYVQSRSYRAPEVILGLPYDEKIDLWSLGCILVELCSGEVLFPNDVLVILLARMIGSFLCYPQVLFPNDVLVILLARMIGILGPIDVDMLAKGQETHKYFTEDYDLYLINEETNQPEYLNIEKSSLEHHLQVSDRGFVNFVRDLLEMNPQRRPTAREALEHPWLSHHYKL